MPEKSIKEKHLIISKSQELLMDLETPVSAFYKICDKVPYSFLLESVEGGEKIGRYSIIGTDPIFLFTSKNNKTILEDKVNNTSTELNSNPFSALKETLQHISVSGTKSNFLGFVGFFGFETIRWIEPKTKYSTHLFMPDACLMFPGKLVIFDHVLHKVNLIVNTVTDTEDETEETKILINEKLNSLLEALKEPSKNKTLLLNYSIKNSINHTSNYTKEQFQDMVIKSKEYIRNGDIFQVVLSQKFTIKGNHDGFLLYRALRSINPSPYLFYLNFNDFEIAGSSPEVMVKCEQSNGKRIASLRPIAGTYPRGINEDEDIKNITKLSNDNKEKAEHLMLVDLARNDLGRVCEISSINVPELMKFEKYSHVIHMVSQVEGVLRKEKTSVDLLSACFPAGTLSGAPKVRALEIINELENEQRGPYGGCTGFFGTDDSINTCMTIRTFIVHKNYLEIQAGAGIVADSNPESEYYETIRKGAALLEAVSLIQGTA
jgi:anthranilate synthase component 1